MPDSTPRPERNAAIVAALDADPYLTLQAVGDKYGLTRERVRQIYKKATMGRSRDRRPLASRRCRICGQRYPRSSVSGAEHAAQAGHGVKEYRYRRNREWEQLYEDGLSSVQIARIYGTSPTAVVAQLHRSGRVQLRPKNHKGSVYVIERYHIRP